MQVIENNQIKSIINDTLKNSISYSEYREMVSKLVEDESTSGTVQTEALVNFTMLNDRRMKRWDKTVKVPEEVISKVKNHGKAVTWLVLTESWCGDAAHVMPVINKVASLNDHIDFRIVLRDENEALMNEFLTNGSKSIPKLIAIDTETENVMDSYGSRPSIATDLVNEYKAKHGELTPEFKEDLQRWYNKDKGQTAIQDLLAILN